MKALIKSKEGFSLIEMVIAIALFTVISCGVVGALVTSQRTTVLQYESRPKYESAVGIMDEKLDQDLSAVAGEDISVSVQFPGGGTSNVSAKAIRNADMQNVAIVKKK